jgi:hypothetical protein
VRLVSYPAPLYERLVTLYEVGGNDEMAGYYRRKLRESSEPPQEHLPEQ